MGFPPETSSVRFLYRLSELDIENIISQFLALVNRFLLFLGWQCKNLATIASQNAVRLRN
jgi:hypothetical protein